MTALTSASRNTRQGRALALVQADRKAGPIALTVSAPGLPEGQISLRSE